LLLKDPFLDDIARQVGPSTTYFHLHPPILKTFGLKRKIRIRSTWAIPMFKVLRTMRPLRGTPFDPFGHVAMRQRERKLIDDYERCVRQAAEMLATFPEKAVAVASLPEKIRGYEELKNHGIDLFNETARSLLNLSDSGDPKRVSSTP
jgi:indolepyruvate ferredoxin oxidoreductase